ncbi:NrfD/PsrC family molybdoenzyme membrane anchor subunit [Nitrospirota bacterium]
MLSLRWRGIGLIALTADIAANGNLGAIFGMLYGRDLWYGPFLPIFFITSGTMTGAAAIIFFTWLAYKINGKTMEPAMAQALKSVAKLCALLIVIVLFFITWNIVTGLVGNERKVNAIYSYLTGAYAVNFWIFEIFFALLIPLALLLLARGKNIRMMLGASIFMLIGIFVMRYDFVILGQVVSGFQEMGVNEYRHLLVYTPSFHEIGIVVGAFGLAAISFMLGERVFKGHTVEPYDEEKGGQS